MRIILRLAAILLVHGTLSGPAKANAPLCRSAIAAVERGTFVPDRLMQAIAIMESGRRDGGGSVEAWPWTINVEGVGHIFASKAEAIAAVAAHRAQGARSIDVGCMQVNLMHHPDAFASLDDAFDPAANARYAGRFLQQLLAQTGSWPLAVAAYHSLTPDIGGDYARKVLAIWARPEQGRTAPPAATVHATPDAGVVAALPGGGMGATAGRIMPMPGAANAGSAGAGITGRQLSAYRAMPTRMSRAYP